jgi:hypothetical protein
MRKRTNALRRIFQRTLSNEDLRESRKNRYMTYQAAIRKDKTSSWKQYCNTTIPGNPWDEVYNLATKYGNTNYATKIRRLKTSKYNRNTGAHGGTAHPRRQPPRRHGTSQEPWTRLKIATSTPSSSKK